MLILIGLSNASAQETEVSHKGLFDRLQQSLKTTGEGPFRTVTVIKRGQAATGPWKPFSSWIFEAVPPDRSRIRHTSGSKGLHINIGNRKFSKPDGKGKWVESVSDVPPSTGPPANPNVGFQGSVVNYTETRDGDAVTVQVVLKPNAATEPSNPKTRTYIYYFDSKGVLIRKQLIFPDGTNWILRTDTYEYDPTIRIEAPID